MDDALRKLAQSVQVIRGLHRGMGGRDAPHEPQKEKFNLPKIKPSTDNPHEVGEANFEHYDIAGHSLVPISSLSGGVNLNHPDQRHRVDALKQKISRPTEGYISRILADDEGNVLEGQHRLEALRELGATHIPITTIHNKARHIDMPALHNAIRGQGGIMSDHVGQIARMAIDSAHESGTPTKAREEWEAPHGFEDRWHSALNELERQHKITKSEGGDVEGFKKGGSPEFDKIREALSRTVSPFSEDPEHVKEALRIASTLKVPQGTKAGTGSFYNLVSPHAVSDVKSIVTDIPNVTHHDPRQMTWEDLHREGKGGSFINVAGDRTNFGRLTHINDKELAWPVDLHAGPKYMLEPNKGEVWANNPTHATGFYNKIMEAGKKGPVYGIYAPMGAQSGDFAHHMFDALMAQIPNSGLTKEGAEAFNKIVKAGLHRPEKDRAKAKELMKNWPGIENPKEASEFARSLPGSHRAGMVKQLDSKFMRNMGMPDVGVTRVAITDPAMRNVAGNMLGHRVVRFDPSRMGPPDRSFVHTSYPSATFGEYVGDLPLVQRHYAAPDVTEKQLAKRAGKEKNVIIHPYSMDDTGRATYRKAFEEQKQIQPINQRMLESVQQGIENQKLYGLKRGGTAYKKGGDVEGHIHPAHAIHGIHVGSNVTFTGAL